MLKFAQAKAWLKEAGTIALRYFRNVNPSIKDDKTYVTEADLAVQSYLKEKIIENYPDVGILSEEENYTKKPLNGRHTLSLTPLMVQPCLSRGYRYGELQLAL